MNAELPSKKPLPPDIVSDGVHLAAVQEELAVGVTKTETGAVRVRKVVHEEMQPVAMQLRSEQVEVSRGAINRAVHERIEPRQEGDTLIVPVYEYVPVVRMQLTLKEEVHIKTTETHNDVVQQVLVNAEELIVERRDGPDGEWKRHTNADC